MGDILTLTELHNEFGNLDRGQNLLAILLDKALPHQNACRIAAEKANELINDLDATIAECADADDLIAEARRVRGEAEVSLITLTELRDELDRLADPLQNQQGQATRERAAVIVRSLAAGLEATVGHCPDVDEWIKELRGTEYPGEPRLVKEVKGGKGAKNKEMANV